MNRYVVPDRMLARAYKVLDQSLRPTNNPGLILLSAIEWLAENPIIPTDEQFRELQSEWGYSRAVFGEWQRRMFLAPEPEVPEGIVDLLASAEFGSPAARLDAQKINHRVIEAYRRGQKAGQQ